MRVNQADLQDRGLHYGDGLFETLLYQQGNILFWSEHYTRLKRGCSRLQIPLPEQNQLREYITRQVKSVDKRVVKLIVTRGSGGRGLQLPEPEECALVILDYDYDPALIGQPQSTIICDTRLPDNPNLAGLKHLNRLDYVMATLELKLRPDYSEGLLRDAKGNLIESIVHNIVVKIGEHIYTPGLQNAGVAGVMREKIMRWLDQQNQPVFESTLDINQLLKADECFLCNSVYGIRPIQKIEEKTFTTGPLTRKLQDVFHPQFEILTQTSD